MANLQKVVKLTQAQYNTLSSGGTVGEYTGLSDNYLYLVRDTSDALSAYPVGSIYISTDPTSPAQLFGGNWQRILGRTLMANIPLNVGDRDDLYPLGYEDYWLTDPDERPTDFYIPANDGAFHPAVAQNMALTGPSSIGVVNHQLSINEMPSHKHTAYLGTTSSSGSVSWGKTNFNWNGSQPYAWPDTVVLGDTGGNRKHNNMPPFFLAYMWQRTP